MKRNVLWFTLIAACGADPAPTRPSDPDAGTDSGEYAVLVRGQLFTADLAAARARHDPLAAGGEAAAKSQGDFAHDVALGSGIFGTAPDAFAAIDRWRNRSAMEAFYADPQFAQGFMTLFSGPPVVETFQRRADFHGWGDLDSGEGSAARFLVIARGRLAGDTVEHNRAAHDQAAMGGETQVRMAGDVAHVAYLGLADPREFVAFDVWTSSAAIQGVYTDPGFQQAFGALFAAPGPTLEVHQWSSWHQW